MIEQDFSPSAKRLFIAIVVQALKDYCEGKQIEGVYLKEEVKSWVKSKNAIFDLCAAAIGTTPAGLEGLMITKMSAIDKGESLYINSSSSRIISHRNRS